MNNLLEAMASDMNIRQYWKETEDSFQYRIILSALGQWCLRSASSPDYSITKHSQTILLNELLEKYLDLFPKIKPMFETDYVPVSVFIRRVYEEMGYLFTDLNNKNHIASSGKCVEIDHGFLYLGAYEPASVFGLGVITDNYAPSLTNWRELLIRDNLTW